MENLDPPHNKSKFGKGVLWLSRSFILDLGVLGFFAVPFDCVHDCNLGQNKVKFRPPPSPKSKMGKWWVLAFAQVHP